MLIDVSKRKGPGTEGGGSDPHPSSYTSRPNTDTTPLFTFLGQDTTPYFQDPPRSKKKKP